MQLDVARQLLDHVPFQKSPRTDAVGSGSGSREVGLGPQLVSLWWTSTDELEEESDFSTDTKSGRHRILLEEKIKIPGCIVNRQGKAHECVCKTACNPQTRLGGEM